MIRLNYYNSQNSYTSLDKTFNQRLHVWIFIGDLRGSHSQQPRLFRVFPRKIGHSLPPRLNWKRNLRSLRVLESNFHYNKGEREGEKETGIDKIYTSRRIRYFFPSSLFIFFSNRSLAHRGSSLDGVGMNYKRLGELYAANFNERIYIYIHEIFWKQRTAPMQRGNGHVDGHLKGARKLMYVH